MVIEASVSPHHTPIASFAKLLPAASEPVRRDPCDFYIVLSRAVSHPR